MGERNAEACITYLPNTGRLHILLRLTWHVYQIDHTLDHNIQLNKCKLTESTHYHISDYK